MNTTDQTSQSRQQRAEQILKVGMIEQDSKGFVVRSSPERPAYRIRTGHECECPDKTFHCKHRIAVELRQQECQRLAAMLCQEWSGHLREYPRLVAEYEQLWKACEGYQPPRPGFLTAFSVEAGREDLVFEWRLYRKLGNRVTGEKPPEPWCAKILGLCREWEFKREFMRGHKDMRDATKKGRSGVRMCWELPDGVYEAQEVRKYVGPAGLPIPTRFFIQVSDGKCCQVEKKEVLECLKQNSKAS